MFFKTLIIVFFCSCIFNSVFSQDKTQRTFTATKTNIAPKIDGDISDEIWNSSDSATNFVSWKPVFGSIEKNNVRTVVKLLYDNNAIYVSGMCYEQSKDSISTEFVGRDQVGTNDFVGIIFDTYNDKQNGFGFYVTPLGEQFDAKYSQGGNEDPNWSAVWQSESKLLSNGWSFEMRIPYSCLRFSEKIETWGLNITRKRVKGANQTMWNPVDPAKNGLLVQSGLMTNIKDIKAPLRLSLSPYFSAYLNHFPYNQKGIKNTSTSFNGGADLKYGINQNFTLDMTLVPDFGQVASDKLVLNLTPFEVQYDENRPFFTEGTELFTKGGLFYSRRIGSQPINKYQIGNQLNSNEEIIDNPNESKLLNAFKISGRNSKGLGMGIFNAVVNSMYATVEDTLTNTQRKIETGPLSNYNILVFDQSLKHGSSVTLLNTNVIRNGSTYDANVTSGMFDIYDKNNNLNPYGTITVSHQSGLGKNITGFSSSLGFAKLKGNFNINFRQSIYDDKYDINDMGIMDNNNYIEEYLWFGYKFLKPNNFFKSLYLNFNNTLQHRYSDKRYQAYFSNINFNSTLKKNHSIGATIAFKPKTNDFYEPRNSNYFFIQPRVWSSEFWFARNQAKKYYFDFAIKHSSLSMFKGNSFYVGVGNRYKFSDKISVASNFTFRNTKNDIGFGAFDQSTNEIIFSRRNLRESENTLNLKYSFNKKMWIRTDFRHYWSQVKPQQFYTLNNSGTLDQNSTYNRNQNLNFNLFNMDMNYSYEFRPGSFLSLVWKNAIFQNDREVQNLYFKNLNNTLRSDANNNFSIKILYYLDYNDVMKRKR